MNSEFAVVYTYEELTTSSGQKFVARLQSFIANRGLPISEAQLLAWQDCYDFLLQHLETYPINPKLSFVFEYFLPLEGGRRPDVILLLKNKVIIMEFKRKGKVLLKDQEQAINYRQDIQNYHQVTNDLNMKVESYLVQTLPITNETEGLIPLITKDVFSTFIERHLLEVDVMDGEAVTTWINSKYQPLQNIILASKNLFETGKLPQIKRIQESDIQAAIDLIDKVVQSDMPEKSIVFINGVPGSGKTLIGLKTVFQYLDQGINPIFLSGNGPLVNVLQGVLSENGQEGQAFVRDMYAFIFEKGHQMRSLNQYVVFDEAQRAWDEKKMKGASEPEQLLNRLDQVAEVKGKVTLVCLIGEGQVIHDGEEQGMRLWKDALAKHSDWIAISSEHFSDLHSRQVIRNELSLDTSIRSNFIDVHPMVEAILDGNIDLAKEFYLDILKQGYQVRIVRDFRLIPNLVTKLKSRRPNDQIGLFISSKVHRTNLKKIFPKSFRGSYIDKKEAYHWYMKDCDRLESAASEFLCQGLESEWPIVCFGGDFYLKNGKWTIEETVLNQYSFKYENLRDIMENIYRVLLTRSRQGMFLYLPHLPDLEESYEFFKDMGINEIGVTYGKN